MTPLRTCRPRPLGHGDATKRRLRRALTVARKAGCTSASFARYMDAVVPDWRAGPT